MKTLTDQFSDAAVYGDFDTVKSLLAEHPNLLNQGDDYGFTALHNMMSEEQFEILQYLIDQGIDVNVQNKDGIAPLHLACWVKNAEMLLVAGADVNLLDRGGRTPLHIHAAEGEQNHDIIRHLLIRGGDPNLKDHSGELPMDIAKSRQDSRNIKLLSEHS